MTVSERKGRERAPNIHRARETPKQLRIDRKGMNRERRSEEAGTVGRREKRGCPASLARVHREVSGCGSRRRPRGAGRARPNSGRPGLGREAPDARICDAGRKARENPGDRQEVPYRHTATLPPHPLRSRCSAPPGAPPRRPTWPPYAQVKGGDQQPLSTPSPASPSRGARRGAKLPASERREREPQIQGRPRWS